jgi:hypothetical protein
VGLGEKLLFHRNLTEVMTWLQAVVCRPSEVTIDMTEEVESMVSREVARELFHQI